MKKLLKRLQNERGSEALQALLLSGIALVLVVLVFFPTVKGLIETTSSTVVTWWNNQSSKIFTNIPDGFTNVTITTGDDADV